MKKQETLRDYFRLSQAQIGRAREIKDQVIFPDPVSAAIYLKTIAQAQKAFTLLELLVVTYPNVAETLHETLIYADEFTPKEKDSL